MEHKEGARKALLNSKFYRLFLQRQKMQLDTLKLYSVLGFTIGDNDIRNRIASMGEGESTFNFSKEEVSKMKGLNNKREIHWRLNAII